MTVLNIIADLVIIASFIIGWLVGYHWIANHTWRKWREDRLWKQADKEKAKATTLPAPLPPPEPETFEPPMFVIYEMADGSMIDDFQFVTGLEWFDDRDREERLMKRTYKLVSEELVILPDPHPDEDEDDEVDNTVVKTWPEEANCPDCAVARAAGEPGCIHHYYPVSKMRR